MGERRGFMGGLGVGRRREGGFREEWRGSGRRGGLGEGREEEGG